MKPYAGPWVGCVLVVMLIGFHANLAFSHTSSAKRGIIVDVRHEA